MLCCPDKCHGCDNVVGKFIAVWDMFLVVLILHFSGVYVICQSDYTALMMAADHGHFEIVQLLLNSGATVNDKSKYVISLFLNKVFVSDGVVYKATSNVTKRHQHRCDVIIKFVGVNESDVCFVVKTFS